MGGDILGGDILGGGIFGLEKGQRLRRCNLIWWMIELDERTKTLFWPILRPSIEKFHHIRFVLYWVPVYDWSISLYVWVVSQEVALHKLFF
jgi:hypothetical protein